MILIIDNYDSFTFNLVHYVEENGFKTNVFRNDQISLKKIKLLNPKKIIISPKITKNIIEQFAIECNLRKNTAGDGFAITSYGNLVLDCRFESSDTSTLSTQLSEVPGVLEHGIFLNIVHIALIASNGDIKKYQFNW